MINTFHCKPVVPNESFLQIHAKGKLTQLSYNRLKLGNQGN